MMMKKKYRLAALAALLLMSCPGSSFAQYQPNWASLDHR